MPELKSSEFPLEQDDLVDPEDNCSPVEKLPHHTAISSSSSGEDNFNHPNVPDNVPVLTKESDKNLSYVNQAFSPDEDGGIPLQLADLNYLNQERGQSYNTVHSTMPINEKSGAAQSLSLPEGHIWMETDRGAFISQRIQDLVQAFQARTEKVKEKLVQPPTPSPSPPLDNSSENGQTPERKGRPRLHSLFQQDDQKSELEVLSDTISLWCCRIKRKFLPSFSNVIDPQSKVYISWLFFVMVSYVYNAWSIVLRAVFPYQTPANVPIFLAFDYISDIIYVLDIALFKVRLQFLHDGFWVDDYKKTRANYMQKRMFKLDVLSLFPMDLLYFVYGIHPLFRMPRLLKVQTFWEFFHRVDAVAKTPYVIRIIRTLIYMMYLIHLNACAYYAMSTWEGIGSNGWVFQGEGNAYIRCFYFATKTATSIGKNPKPENEYEYVFMTISWLMGVFIFAFLIGQIRDIVATATQSRTQYRQLMDQTVMYMRNLNLPDDLQRRVRLWLNHTWEQQKTLNESGILDSLPRKMKTDVAIHVHYNTLVKVQLFKDCDKALLRDLVLQLKPVLFLPGDYICKKGEVGKEMYIVNKGIVQVFGGEKSDVVLATLSEGSVFGEISLLGIPGCNRRTADVRSKGFSNLFVLSKDDLWEALKNYPEAQKVLRKKAKCLIKENEARDQAKKGINLTIAEPETVIKLDERRASTPKLIRTVLQMIPKESKCVQKLSKTPSKDIPLNIPAMTDTDETKISNVEASGNISPNISENSKDKEISPKIFQSHDSEYQEQNQTDKPRSMSDGTLQKQQSSQESTLLHQKATTATGKISPATNKNSLQTESHTKTEDSKTPDEVRDILKTILSMVPNEYYDRRRNAVYPVDTEIPDNILPTPNTTSEDSGISVDNSAHQISEPKVEDDDSISESEVNSCDSDASSDISTTSTRRIAGDSAANKDRSSPWISSSTSTFSLRGLFGTSSSQSSSSTNKDIILSPIPKDGAEKADNIYASPTSLTSRSSSTGYDNLSFIPGSVLSRRSSTFSDSSC